MFSGWSWGSGNLGQLVNNSFDDSSLPTQCTFFPFNQPSLTIHIESLKLSTFPQNSTFLPQIRLTNNTNESVSPHFESLDQLVHFPSLKFITMSSGGSHSQICFELINSNNSSSSSSSHILLSWGGNDSGQLGIGSFTNHSNPQPVHSPTPLSSLSSLPFSSDSHSSSGLSDLSHPFWKNKDQKFELKEGVFNQKCISLGCGWDFSVIVTESGKVYSFGNNSHNQLGFISNNKITEPTSQTTKSSAPKSKKSTKKKRIIKSKKKEVYCTPIELEFVNNNICNNKIISVSCGLRHCLSLSQLGNVYSWGESKFGQVGQGRPNDEGTCPTPQLIKSLQNVKIIKVQCGARHSLCLSDEGKVYSFGSNKRGQLGIGTRKRNTEKENEKESEKGTIVEDQYSPVLIEYSTSPSISTTTFNSSLETYSSHIEPIPKIKDIHCGWFHTILLTENTEKLFVCGRNDYGQLGVGDLCDRFLPFLLCVSFDVSKICCGSEHNLLLSKNGEVYSWGWNEHGQLGVGDEINRCVPTLVSIPSTHIGLTNTSKCASTNSIFKIENILCGNGCSYAW